MADDYSGSLAAAILSAEAAVEKENYYRPIESQLEGLGQLGIPALQEGNYGQGLGAIIMSGLLSGVAGGLGDQYTANRVPAYTAALQGQTLVPGSTEAPAEVLSPSLFKRADTQASVFKMLKEQAQQEALQKYTMEGNTDLRKALLDKAGVMALPNGKKVYIEELDPITAKIREEQAVQEFLETGKVKSPVAAEAEPIATTEVVTDPNTGEPIASIPMPSKVSSNPDAPSYRANQDIKAAEDKARASIGGKLGADFQDVKASFESLKALDPLDDRVSSMAVIQAFARIQDPGVSVRSDDFAEAKNTRTFLEGLGYDFESLMNGEDTLGTDTRAAMIRAAGVKYNSLGGVYSEQIGKEKSLIAKRGGDPENVFGPVDYKPFDFIDYVKNRAPSRTLDEDMVAGGAQPTQPTAARRPTFEEYRRMKYGSGTPRG